MVGLINLKNDGPLETGKNLLGGILFSIWSFSIL